MEKLYPESGVELNPFVSKYYDKMMNILSFGKYKGFIHRAIRDMHIQKEDAILDFGCGTGRNACLMRQYLGEKGFITGLDISDIMGSQFKKNCAAYDNTEFLNQRIDLPFHLEKKYDKVFISFVLHGFPQNIRENIIRNAFDHLKPGGTFNILDFGEFDMHAMPFYYRIPFQKGECPYAFDFIERDLKMMLSDQGFDAFEEHLYFKNYARLMVAKKPL
jgi:ubiquinone/menaquinone biosynthesis C-methylase UbiE